MMARTSKEWIGRTDDSAIPERVQLRVWQRAEGHCQICRRKIMAGEAKHYDHKVALIDGGRNAESNLQIACVACHGIKTSAEATERAKVRAKAKAVLGIRTAPKRPIRSPGFGLSEHKAKRSQMDKLPVPAPRQIYVERNP